MERLHQPVCKVPRGCEYFSAVERPEEIDRRRAMAFEGMGLLDRQRMVNGALREEMASIHALQMKTWTPAQFEKKKASVGL